MNEINIGEQNRDFGFNLINNISTGKLIELDISTLEPAPEEWNFYKTLNSDKMEELLNSIMNNGLLVPIIVWELSENNLNNKHMILSGHNRVRAYKILKEDTGDSKYSKIQAIIKKKSELSDDEAREIIIDTNWVQRTLSPIEKAKSIIEKYTVLKSKSLYNSNYNKYGEGRTRDLIGEQFKISGRTVERYKNLNFLIDDLSDLVNNNKLSISVASKISLLDKDIQSWLFKNYRNNLNSKYINHIRKDMTIDEIEDIFIDILKTEEIKKISVKIPKNTYTIYTNIPLQEKENLENKIIKLINSYKE